MSQMPKTVRVTLDRERSMRLTLAEAKRFRELTKTEARPEGISLLRGDLARERITEDEWIALFFTLLAHEDPDLTQDRVAELVDMAAFVRLGEGFEQLFDAFKAKGAEAAPADPTASPAVTS